MSELGRAHDSNTTSSTSLDSRVISWMADLEIPAILSEYPLCFILRLLPNIFERWRIS